MLLPTRCDRLEGALDSGQHERTRILHREGERRVEDVGGREAVVQPAALLPERVGHRVDERSHVVPGLALARGDLVGQRRLLQRALEVVDHRSCSSASASASSARRSRELTVPRGRSSIAAISPGV